MALRGYPKCAKYFTFATAIIEIILALFAIGFGIYMCIVQLPDDIPEVQKNLVHFGGVILIIVGCVTLLNGILGIVGSIKENFGCLIAHAVIIALSILGGIINMVTGVFGFAYICYVIYQIIRCSEMLDENHWMDKNRWTREICSVLGSWTRIAVGSLKWRTTPQDI
ncbi:hypothetical protein CHUAL_001280 [Chamberlinius hualienensis]